MNDFSLESQAALLPTIQELPASSLGLHDRLIASKTLATVAVCASLLLSAEATQAKELAPPKGGPAGQIGMSDEFTETRWAYADNNSPVRRWPSKNSKPQFPLRIVASDGSAEVYVVRSTWTAPSGREWARIRIPARPRPTEGWVARSALSNFGVSDTAIRINRKTMRLTMYEDGKPVLRTPVGVGAPKTPTPGGNFWVRSRFKVNQNESFRLFGKDIPMRVYGPRIIMTSAQSVADDNWPGGGIIGIHGTNQPQLIPGRPSHGCVRVPNKNILRIYQHISTGTPVKIV
jgi:hypothetical protein